MLWRFREPTRVCLEPNGRPTDAVGILPPGGGRVEPGRGAAELGQEGWELVSILPETRMFHGFQCLFKRPCTGAVTPRRSQPPAPHRFNKYVSVRCSPLKGVDSPPFGRHHVLLWFPNTQENAPMATAETLLAPAANRPQVRQTRLLIDNQWVDPAEGGEFETYDPATGEVIAPSPPEPPRMSTAPSRPPAAPSKGPLARIDAADRGNLLYNLADLVERERGRTRRVEVLNAARPSTTPRAIWQGVNTLRYYAGWADKVEGKTIPVRGNFLSYTLRQPVGVVGQIIPWNFPLLMLAWKWGPALACGNTIVMKPAEQTPLTALRLGELAIEAGFPAGVINLINGFGEIAGARLGGPSRRRQDRLHRPCRHRQDHPDSQAAETLKRTHLRARRQEPQRHLRRR